MDALKSLKCAGTLEDRLRKRGEEAVHGAAV